MSIFCGWISNTNNSVLQYFIDFSHCYFEKLSRLNFGELYHHALTWGNAVSTGIMAAGALLTAFAAWAALNSWKKQDLARRQLDYLDTLLESGYSYKYSFMKPLLKIYSIQLYIKHENGISADARIEIHHCNWSAAELEKELGELFNETIKLIDDIEPLDSKLFLYQIKRSLLNLGKFSNPSSQAQITGVISSLRSFYDDLTDFKNMLQSKMAIYDESDSPRYLELINLEIRTFNNNLAYKYKELVDAVQSAYNHVYGHLK